MIKSKLKELARDLFLEEKDTPEIIEILNVKGRVSQATVYRWINEFRSSQDETQKESESADEDSDETQEDSQSIEQDSPETQRDSQKTFESRKEKRSTLKESRRLLRELLELPADHKWNLDALGSYLNRLETIQDKIESALEYDPDLYQANLIWNVVTDYINKFELLRRSGDTKRIISQKDLINLEEMIQLDTVLDVEEFDEPYYIGLAFIGKTKTFLQVASKSFGQSFNKKDCESLKNQIQDLILFASQNELSDEFKKDIEALNSLKKEFENHFIKVSGSSWADKTFRIEESLKGELVRMGEVSFTVS